MIKEKLNILLERDTVPVFSVDIKEKNDSNVSKAKKLKKYEYYICDYCNQKINLDKKIENRNGGTVIFPHSLTKKRRFKISIV